MWADALEVKDSLKNVTKKILVLSGKGGVGKSTFAAQMVWALAQKHAVGVFDLDICGPSMPRMFGVENEGVHRSGILFFKCSAIGWQPVFANDNIAVMSIGFLLQKKTDAVVWRGPRKHGIIRQFLVDTCWGELDYMIVDSPPGTSDEHIGIAQLLKESGIDGAVLITTPQEISLLDVRKEVTFCRKVGIPIIGVVENMSGFICPCCNEKSDIFPSTTGGAKKMCEEMKIPFLGAIPIDPVISKCCEEGKSFMDLDRPAKKSILDIVDSIKEKTRSVGPKQQIEIEKE